MSEPPPPDRAERVVPLRRPAAVPGGRAGATQSSERPPVDDLRRFEVPETREEYRQRMVTNAAGLAVIVLLILAGVWIADMMASMRKNQDCVLSGRRGCTPVETPLPQRW